MLLQFEIAEVKSQSLKIGGAGKNTIGLGTQLPQKETVKLLSP
jgi:hypothetical protein